MVGVRFSKTKARRLSSEGRSASGMPLGCTLTKKQLACIGNPQGATGGEQQATPVLGNLARLFEHPRSAFLKIKNKTIAPI